MLGSAQLQAARCAPLTPCRACKPPRGPATRPDCVAQADARAVEHGWARIRAAGALGRRHCRLPGGRYCRFWPGARRPPTQRCGQGRAFLGASVSLSVGPLPLTAPLPPSLAHSRPLPASPSFSRGPQPPPQAATTSGRTCAAATRQRWARPPAPPGTPPAQPHANTRLLPRTDLQNAASSRLLVRAVRPW
jgi:hypothetical protein